MDQFQQPPVAATWAAPPPAPEKSSELLIRDFPQRSIAIVSSSHALILRYSSSATEALHNGSHGSLASARGRAADSAVAKCMVEFSPISQRLLREYRPLAPRPIYGTLGLMAVDGQVFLSVITRAVRAATARPGETVERIASVAFYCLSSANYDDVVPLEPNESDMSEASWSYSNSSSVYGQGLGRRDVPFEHPCHDLRKLLSNGSFYYSTDFDLTSRVQERPLNSNSFDIDNFDETFLWNSFMISPLVQFRSRLMPPEREALDSCRFLTSAIRGFCKTMTIPRSSCPLGQGSRSGKPSYLTLISRLSCKRAGTRFNSRGIDDDGHVANFVESETTFWSPVGVLFSYAQVRGSVPVFWEQTAELLPGRQRITITRSSEGTQPVLNRHFEQLEHTYGAVHIINLLSETKPAEMELSTLYRNGVRNCPLSRPGADGSPDDALLRETHYDFHAETKGPAGYEAARDIRRYIEHSMDSFVYFLAEKAGHGDGHGQGDENGDDDMRNDDMRDDDADDARHKKTTRLVVVMQQDGVFRTNCLDCLDRTNLIQTLISQMAIEAFLAHRNELAASDFWMRHASLWADNGDSLSKIYAGTGALKSSFTRHGKMSLAGAVADMRKSVQRIYHNNFLDPSRQVTIDMLLGRLIGQAAVHLYDPISDYVSAEVARRSDEYTSFDKMSIWTGTFNLNGRTQGIDEDLSAWLLPKSPDAGMADIYVVAFQEIVQLSPQQIMNSDPSRRQLWERAVKYGLNGRRAAGSKSGDRYVLLRSGQLVGAALCIFVKTSVLCHIKNVEGSVKKTGLSGMAGNKGAVAIRFDYAKTQVCFVTAHLAAGFANYDERNRDYATIHQGLRFQRNRGIEDHDAIIWLGDFNYRIGLALEATRALMKRGDLETLYENDQLNLQMVAGLAFDFYSEARIGFMPTYKFDLGTDDYDTSEKARIPAWTDRILKKGAILRQLSYDSAPLRFSDHRPVYGVFQCKVTIVDEILRKKIGQQLYQRRKAEIGDTTAHVGQGQDTDDEDLIGYDAIEPGLPPASSDRHKWWLDHRQPARAHVSIPSGRDGHGMTLNPQRPSNPFAAGGEEADWVSVRRLSTSSFSSSTYEKVPHPARPAGGRQEERTACGEQQQQQQLQKQHNQQKQQQQQQQQQQQRQGQDQDQNGRNGRQQRRPVPPPPPPPPRSSAKTAATHLPTTQQQQTQEKSPSTKSPPPPVAKKPAHLLATPSATALPNNSIHTTRDERSGAARPQLPPRRATATEMARKPAPAAQKTWPRVAGPDSSASQLQRRTGTGLVDSALPHDESKAMSGWQALQPSNKS